MIRKFSMFGRLVFTILAMLLGLTACAETRGRNSGIITVSNVGELVHAIQTAINSDTIVVSTNGSPYKLSEVESMSRVGHLYIDKTITIRGQSGRAEDVVLEGSTNRIMYINAPGCMIGGIWFKNGECRNNTITNAAPKESGYGGAIYLSQADSECLVMNCRFSFNKALRGGAIASAKIGERTSIIDGCKFDDNDADVYGGAIYGVNEIKGCYFEGNESMNTAGAVAYASNLVESVFYMNSAYKGGAAAFSVLTGCFFTNDVAESGAELYNCTATNIEIKSEGTSSRLYNVTMNRGRITVTNGVLFTGTCNVRNTLVADGAYFSFCKSMRKDGQDVDPQFINCTIVNNKDYRLRHTTKSESGVDFRNCLFVWNRYPERVISPDEVDDGNYDVDSYAMGNSVFYSCIFKYYTDPGSDILPVYNCFFNQQDEDMKFAGADKMPRDPYAIDKASSACHRNFSKNGMSQITIEPWMLTDVDLLGNPRLYGGGLDVGCYQALSLISRATVIKFR